MADFVPKDYPVMFKLLIQVLLDHSSLTWFVTRSLLHVSLAKEKWALCLV